MGQFILSLSCYRERERESRDYYHWECSLEGPAGIMTMIMIRTNSNNESLVTITRVTDIILYCH